MLPLTLIMWPARKRPAGSGKTSVLFSLLCVVAFLVRFWQNLFTVTVWEPDVTSQTSAILPFSLLSSVPECSQVTAKVKQHVSSDRVILSINIWPKQNKKTKTKVQPVLIQWRIPCLNVLVRAVVTTGRDHGREWSQELCICWCTGWPGSRLEMYSNLE